jgi:hypothetical protein
MHVVGSEKFWRFVNRISGPGYFILFCCKGTVGPEASNLSEAEGVRLKLLKLLELTGNPKI